MPGQAVRFMKLLGRSATSRFAASTILAWSCHSRASHFKGAGCCLESMRSSSRSGNSAYRRTAPIWTNHASGTLPEEKARNFTSIGAANSSGVALRPQLWPCEGSQFPRLLLQSWACLLPPMRAQTLQLLYAHGQLELGSFRQDRPHHLWSVGLNFIMHPSERKTSWAVTGTASRNPRKGCEVNLAASDQSPPRHSIAGWTATRSARKDASTARVRSSRQISGASLQSRGAWCSGRPRGLALKALGGAMAQQTQAPLEASRN